MADAAFLESIGRHGGGEGCSTLDLMKRLEAPNLTHETLHEMEHIMLADKQHKHQIRIRRGEALIADITKLGDVEEARNKLKPIFIPDKPKPRTLRACKLVGDTTDKKIITSLVRPLSRSCSVQSMGSASCGTTASSSRRSDHGHVLVKPKTGPRTETQIAVDKLKDERLELETNLMHVTKKLYRKYERQVFPSVDKKGATFHSLQTKWSAPNLTEADKYNVYMSGRYATRNDLEFFKKHGAPRDDTNNFHRIHRQHTKYGDSLAFAKHSLRDKF
ncbi:Aste57867_12959 [Aphanomyces stellatus]|uniref:Aste57867_12959 protein n=1 Tax=Aphanomyces stellatus TaxID=120398 RepID=A0A485KWY4_9STRA|nr:hypothetical protein As57867_012911 [Aphanomyces stellatus]VFT89805.1 Aste57867_12959 [Aphanomyces stellatus]